MTNPRPSLSERMRSRPRSAAWGLVLAVTCGVVVLVVCAGCFGSALFVAAHALLGGHPPAHPP